MTPDDPTVEALRAGGPARGEADALADLAVDNTRRMAAVRRAVEALRGRLDPFRAARLGAAWRRLTGPVEAGLVLAAAGRLDRAQQEVLARRLGEVEAVVTESLGPTPEEWLP